MSTSRLLGLSLCCALLGCADEPPHLTELVVVVEPGAKVRAMVDRLDIAVSTGGDAATLVPGTTQTFMHPEWPISLTLLASQPKAALSLVVSTYQGATPLVTRSVLTQFVPERSLLLGLTLEDACIGDPLYCASYTDMTCDSLAGAAMCISSVIDARSLPDYVGQRYDAGLESLPDAGHDAAMADAGSAPASADGGL
jgi:hypothetical protein